MVRYLTLSVILLAAWVLSANTILKPYLASSVQKPERIATEAAGPEQEDAGVLASAPAVLPMLKAPAMPQLAAATHSAATEPVVGDTSGALPAPAEETKLPEITAPVKSQVRLASAAPTVGGADISDAAVIAKAVEPPTAGTAAVMPTPRARPRIAVIPLPRPRPGFAHVAPVSFLGRLFGAH
ncbi:MAG: hypothetical protein R3D62_06695 [Xanthobacteraceae bacterium]